MLRKNIIHKLITLGTLTAVWCVFSMVALAVPTDPSGVITITGQVMVNGQPAISNSTIMSGATVTTAMGSRATVSLGKLGRIEVQEDSSLSLRFTDNDVVAMLDSGTVRVSANSGIGSTVTTKNATFVGDAGQADNYVVFAECSHSHVDTTSGVVSMKQVGSSQQVVAGTTAVAGNLVQTGCKPCIRPDKSNANTPTNNLALLLLLAAGVVGISIYLGEKGNGTPTNPASPTR